MTATDICTCITTPEVDDSGQILHGSYCMVATPSTDEPICGDRCDDETCELEPGHPGAHAAGNLCWVYDDAATA